MIIVEGPDGGGKTTLVEHLSKKLKLPIAPRVVSQETEAMTDLRVWTDDNLAAGFQDIIFDRHRLISDPIYRAVLGGHNPKLYDPDWLAARLKAFQRIQPLLIFCIPPLEVVMLNILDDPNNKVVVNDIERIYYSYISTWSHLAAFGRFRFLRWYDYSNPFNPSADEVAAFVRDEL